MRTRKSKRAEVCDDYKLTNKPKISVYFINCDKLIHRQNKTKQRILSESAAFLTEDERKEARLENHYDAHAVSE